MNRSAVIGVLLMLPSASALAHLNLPPPFPKNPCAVDHKRFCGDVILGQGRLFACMDAHMSQLTSACREQIQGEEALHARAEAIKAKLRAKEIAEGKKPDPLLDPTPIGFMPGEHIPAKMVIHMRPPAKPPSPKQGTSASKPAPATPAPGQATPQNKQAGTH